MGFIPEITLRHNGLGNRAAQITCIAGFTDFISPFKGDMMSAIAVEISDIKHVIDINRRVLGMRASPLVEHRGMSVKAHRKARLMSAD